MKTGPLIDGGLFTEAQAAGLNMPEGYERAVTAWCRMTATDCRDIGRLQAAVERLTEWNWASLAV